MINKDNKSTQTIVMFVKRKDDGKPKSIKDD